MPSCVQLSEKLHQALNRAPLLLPLLCLLSIQLATTGSTLIYGTLLAPLLYLIWQRRWSLLLICALSSAIAFYQLDKQHTQLAAVRQQLLHSPELHLSGTIIRQTPYTAQLQLDEYSHVKVELRGRLQGELGDRVCVHGTPRPLPAQKETLLPGSFDRLRWYDTLSIAGSIDVQSMDIIGHPFSWAALRGYAAQWRELLVRRLIPEDEAHDSRRQVLAALILGEKSHSEASTLEHFLWSGSLHAFAVSGLHVGLVAGLLWALLRLLRLPLQWHSLVILIVVGLYVVLTGMAISSLRAYLMLLLLLLGFMLRRQLSPMNLLSAVALISLMVSPQQLGQAGFLLSFLVYGGILLAIQLTREESRWIGPDSYIPRALHTRMEKALITLDNFLRVNTLISVSAWLISLPILISFFGSWNPYGILTNILITPLLPLVMGLGLLLLPTASIPYLGQLIDSCALESSGLLLTLVSGISGLAGSYLPTTAPMPADAGIIFNLGYGKVACQMGNGGLLLSEGSESDARWRLRPALFSSGMTPSSYLAMNAPARKAQYPVLRALWGKLESLDLLRSPEEPILYTHPRHSDISWRIYPPPLHLLEHPIQSDQAAIVLWQRGEQRILYVGNASALSYEYWEARGVELHADIIILGYHDKQPLLRDEWRRAESGLRVILLPSFPHEDLELFSERACYEYMDERAVVSF